MSHGRSIPDIECHGYPIVAVPADELGSEGRVPQGQCAKHGPGGAEVEDFLDRLDRSQPAGHLDRSSPADGIEDLADHLSMCCSARTCAIEIHDMQPPGSPIHERPGHGQRVIGERRRIGEVALTQADDAPAEEIDRGEYLEGCHVVLVLLSC
jgi:hypothetical protein